LTQVRGVVEDEDGSAVVTFDAFDPEAAATQETREHEIGSLERRARRGGWRRLVHLSSSFLHRNVSSVSPELYSTATFFVRDIFGSAFAGRVCVVVPTRARL
jgi:hypothetical protein